MGCFLELLLRCFGGCFGIQHHDRRRSPKASMNAKVKALEPRKKKEIAKLLGRPDLIHIGTNLYEDVILDCDIVMNPDLIEVECDSHLDAVKKQALFDQVILPLRRPELFSHGGKLLGGPQKGVLLHGPPPSNTGKATLLATAKFIAKESGAVFINARKIANVIMSNRFSDCDSAEKRQLIAAVFSLAYKLQPAVIFINDMDSFLGQLSQTNMKTEFTDLWDCFFTDHKHEHAQVLVLATTSKCNRASPELDEAIQWRLPRVLEIRMPRRKERAEILKLILKGERVEHNIDYDHVAALTEGYAVSDLFQLCKKAAYVPIRDHLLYEEKSGIKQSSPPRPMSQLDLENVRGDCTTYSILEQVVTANDDYISITGSNSQ
ncbi:uncharacterized protein LOC133714876 [Rosa rugosa]|uniref:uncharacterized protein LOC133714876 n=1 Tax=Rosa rugosa TaxID=74645 RepID=UPI002B406BBF|nr:uncharacterized protein LOC133714876 [Rosa rugosa]